MPTDLAANLRSAGFVLALGQCETHPDWFCAEVWIDWPVVPAEHRYLGGGVGPSETAALGELLACLTEQRVADSPHFFAASDAYRARLLAECDKAAAALVGLGIPLPVAEAA